jgi:hypothetical protein
VLDTAEGRRTITLAKVTETRVTKGMSLWDTSQIVNQSIQRALEVGGVRNPAGPFVEAEVSQLLDDRVTSVLLRTMLEGTLKVESGRAKECTRVKLHRTAAARGGGAGGGGGGSASAARRSGYGMASEFL